MSGPLVLSPLPADAHSTAKEASSVDAHHFKAKLKELNGSGASGHARVRVDGNTTHVAFKVRGTSAALPHAVHIHSRGSHECPTAANDTNNDGLVTTLEGLPAYGEIVVSLTTTGDTSAASGLAVARFAPGDENGMIDYSRSFELPVGVDTDDIANGVIVLHGISKLSGDPLVYDGPLKSDLDPSLPEEATIPAVCGPLERVGAPAAVDRLVKELSAAASRFDREVNDALGGLSDKDVRSEFRSSYDAVVAAHLAALHTATDKYRNDVDNGVDMNVARNELINVLDASKAEAFNKLHQAKDRLSGAINRAGGHSSERESFNNDFNSALATLGNELETLKNRTSDSLNQH